MSTLVERLRLEADSLEDYLEHQGPTCQECGADPALYRQAADELERLGELEPYRFLVRAFKEQLEAKGITDVVPMMGCSSNDVEDK